MGKRYVAVDKTFTNAYYTGGSYVVHGETYPNSSSDRSKAYKYKSKSRLQSLIDNVKLPIGGGWNWEIEEVDE